MLRHRGVRDSKGVDPPWPVRMLLLIAALGASSAGFQPNGHPYERFVVGEECAPPPFTQVPTDSAAALKLPGLAERMRVVADSVNQSYLNAVGPAHPAYESPAGYFYSSVERAARAAVELNPGDAGARILYGEMKWLNAGRGAGEYARDSTEGHEAFRQLACGRVLAQQASDSVLLARADSLISWIGPFTVRP